MANSETKQLLRRAQEAEKSARAAERVQKSKLAAASEAIRLAKLQTHVANLESRAGTTPAPTPPPVRAVEEPSEPGGAK